MKTHSKHWLACLSLLCIAPLATAQVNRLALWITEPIGLDAVDKCVAPAKPQTAPLPDTAPTLSEADVIGWNPETARWTLQATAYTATEAMQKLQDHCFVLAIGGKPISRGVVLSSYSARLTRIPTLSVFYQDNTLSLQLNSGSHGGVRNPIHVQAIDAVLASSTRPPAQ
jgi:hypothetical protein